MAGPVPQLDYRMLPDDAIVQAAQSGDTAATMELQRRQATPSSPGLLDTLRGRAQTVFGPQGTLTRAGPGGIDAMKAAAASAGTSMADIMQRAAQMGQPAPGQIGQQPSTTPSGIQDIQNIIAANQTPTPGPAAGSFRAAQELYPTTPEQRAAGMGSLMKSYMDTGTSKLLALFGGGPAAAAGASGPGPAPVPGPNPGMPPQVAAAMAEQGGGGPIIPPGQQPGPNPFIPPEGAGPMPPAAAAQAAQQPGGMFSNLTPEQADMLMRFGLNMMAESAPQAGARGLMRKPGLGEAIGRAGTATLAETDKLSLADRKMKADAAEKEADREVKRADTRQRHEDKLADRAIAERKLILDKENKERDRSLRAAGVNIQGRRAASEIGKRYDEAIANSASDEEAARLKVLKAEELRELGVEQPEVQAREIEGKQRFFRKVPGGWQEVP